MKNLERQSVHESWNYTPCIFSICA